MEINAKRNGNEKENAYDLLWATQERLWGLGSKSNPEA